MFTHTIFWIYTARSSLVSEKWREETSKYPNFIPETNTENFVICVDLTWSDTYICEKNWKYMNQNQVSWMWWRYWWECHGYCFVFGRSERRRRWRSSVTTWWCACSPTPTRRSSGCATSSCRCEPVTSTTMSSNILWSLATKNMSRKSGETSATFQKLLF